MQDYSEPKREIIMEQIILRIDRKTDEVKGIEKVSKLSKEDILAKIKEVNATDTNRYRELVIDPHIAQALSLHDMGNLSSMAEDVTDSLDEAETAVNDAISSLDSFKAMVAAEKLEDIIKSSSEDDLHEVIGLFVKKCDKDAILDKIDNEDIAKYFQEYNK